MPQQPFLQTSRKGAWWAFPLLCIVVFGSFVVYATWAAFQGRYYYSGHGSNYISPFYSPEIFGESPHAWFGKPGWWPTWAPFSPALLILWVPGLFRMALAFLCFLAQDVYEGMWFTGADGVRHFGIGVGTLVLAVNVVLLSGYAFGCHTLRHVVGGARDTMSTSKVCVKAYNCASCFNRKHMVWAWCSLFSVALADLYVRLLSMGVISDWRIL